MSRETLEWLNSNVLVGFTDKRGFAWHYREGADNHYPGAVPIEAVKDRLFGWEAIVTELPCPCGCGEIRKVVSHGKTNHIMGVFMGGYEPHNYAPWLLGTVSDILSDDLQIGSAGLLRSGAVAWVSVEVPENVKTPEGVEFRPHLLATTSFDGSIATTFKRCATFVVCDNTRDYAMSESGQEFRVRHTSNSGLRLQDARDALALIVDTGDALTAEIAALCGQKVTRPEWEAFLTAYVPVPEDEGRGRTTAQMKRDSLDLLYKTDARVAPWAGTAFGVVQAVDTWTQHVSTVRNAQRAERNMLNAITGKTSEVDGAALKVLQAILS